MRLRARDGEARDFLKKVAQKLLIIGCSAPSPTNYNLEKEQILWKSAPFDVIFSFRVQGR
jgi:hypothetical protein